MGTLDNICFPMGTTKDCRVFLCICKHMLALKAKANKPTPQNTLQLQ